MSEIAPNHEYTFRTTYALKPVKKGDAVPDFTLEKDNFRWQQFFNGVETHGPIMLRQMLNKPLVISFYSSHWREYGLNLLKQLNNIQQDIRGFDANLLVISAEKERRLEKLAWDNNMSLSFYFDAQREVAERFGVYSESDPIWTRISGVDINVPLLATYVISPSGKIIYDHIDWNFSEIFPSKEILAAVAERL
ncbi:redoxin domain-containing protein [Mucilaginibacter ginsenosidivorans]|nr:redoxin domain-containing protein [Mucilaginibacter ginsenosidivorans]